MLYRVSLPYIPRLHRGLVISLCVFFTLWAKSENKRAHFLYEDISYAHDATHTFEHHDTTTPAIQRARPVVMTSRLSAPLHFSSEAPIAVGDTIFLPLFDGAIATAHVDRISQPLPGTQTLRGRIQGYMYGYILFSTTDGKTLGRIRLPGKNEDHTVIYNPRENTHYLYDYTGVERDELLPGPPLIPPPDAVSLTPLSDEEVTPHNLPVTIDVMIVYTPAARQWANNNGGGINNVIAQAMGFANLAHDNSATLITKRLVHAAEVAYTESSAGSITDITNLTDPSSGQMDEIHGWRDHYGADLVALFSFVNDTGGLGWILDNRNGQPAYGFSLTRVQQAGWGYTHIHEMGHNMGAHHHKQQTAQPGPTAWRNWPGNTWSAGWRWTGTDNQRYCDLMTYASGQFFPDGQTHTEVPYFSNPNILYQGVSTGHSADGDNARTVREVRHVVAAYRGGPGPAQEWKTDRFRSRILWRQDPTRGTFVIRGSIPTAATSLDAYDGVSIQNLFVLQAGSTAVDSPTGTLETRRSGRVVRGRIINRETRLRILTRMRLRNGEIQIRYRLVRGFNVHTALDIPNTDERSWTGKNLEITLNLPEISSKDTCRIEYRTREDRVSRVRETR